MLLPRQLLPPWVALRGERLCVRMPRFLDAGTILADSAKLARTTPCMLAGSLSLHA